MKRSIKALIATIFASMSIGTAIGVGGFSNAKDDAKVTEAATNSVTLAGSFNGWSTTADPLTLNGDYWTIEKTLAVNDTFKIVVNGSDWVGDGDGVHWCSGMGSEGKGNNFKCLTAGPYRIKAAKTIGDYGDKSYGIYFESLSYTITYDRNKNTGLQETQTKNHGTNVNAYTPGSSPLTASGWNASSFKRFVHWNTKYDDSGDVVNAGATITTNDSFYLYYIEDWYNYRYKVDNGSWVTLVHNDEGKGSGIQAQFAPASAQSLPLHGKLYFQYSANGGSTWTDISSNSITFEGNYDTTEGIELATVDTIYLKITDSNTYTCWVPGISDRTICVFDSSSATTGGTPYTMRGNGDNETVTTMPVYIKKGQFVKRGYAGNYTYGSLFAGGTGNAGSSFQTVGSDTAVECLVTGVYTVYNQRGSYDNWKDIYFTRDEEASASYIAEIFNDIVESVCSGITGGTKSLSDLQAIWGSVSSTELYKHFNNQFAETKNYFKTSSTTTDPEILECVERYDYIVKKYGKTALPDFIGRNNGYTDAPQGAAMVSILSDINKNGSSILIVVIAITATAAAAGGYFFLRRRKED